MHSQSPSEVVANPNPASRYNRFWFRFFEILPGALLWVALIAPFVFAYTLPLVVTIFIILFDVYWLLRSLSYGDILLRGYRRLKKSIATDWMGKLRELNNLSTEEREKLDLPNWNDIYHVIILTTYREEASILEASLDSALAADYPMDKVIVCLATEGRVHDHAQKVASELVAKYGKKFHRFYVSEHPDGIVGEVKAKGANATWAAKQLVKEMNAEGIPLKNVIVTTADADSRFHEQYFSVLTYKFVITPDRLRVSFHPIAMYFNNIWEAGWFSRLLAFGTTFWQLVESVRDYRLVTFATHATCLQTLKDINYWSTSIVNEDSRQYFRAFFHYNGKFRVVPLFIPIYMDAVHVETRWATLKNLYYQQQRWAYGVEHFPYIVLESFRHKKIPIRLRWTLIYRAFAGTFSWGTSAFFLTIVGWLPLILNKSFHAHVAASNFPVVTQVLLSITWVGLLVSAGITLKLLNTVSHDKKPVQFWSMIGQWLLVPFATVFFGAIPGIDAQTRLMLGKYMGFRVTEKAAVKE